MCFNVFKITLSPSADFIIAVRQYQIWQIHFSDKSVIYAGLYVANGLFHSKTLLSFISRALLCRLTEYRHIVGILKKSICAFSTKIFDFGFSLHYNICCRCEAFAPQVQVLSCTSTKQKQCLSLLFALYSRYYKNKIHTSRMCGLNAKNKEEASSFVV